MSEGRQAPYSPTLVMQTYETFDLEIAKADSFMLLLSISFPQIFLYLLRA